MDYSFQFGGDPQDLTVSLAGIVDAPSIRALIGDLTAHPEFRAGLLILTDLSELDTSHISDREFESVNDVITGKDWQFPARAIALVAPDDRTFADATLFRAFVGGARSHREVFRSTDEAVAWLRSQR